MKEDKKGLLITAGLILAIILVLTILYFSGYELKGFVYEKF